MIRMWQATIYRYGCYAAKNQICTRIYLEKEVYHMENNIDFGGFIQVAIIVEDIEKAAQKWAQLFNVPVPEIRLLPAGEDKGLRYRGEPANYALKLAVIQANGWIVELHEPDENPSTFREFLN